MILTLARNTKRPVSFFTFTFFSLVLFPKNNSYAYQEKYKMSISNSDTIDSENGEDVVEKCLNNISWVIFVQRAFASAWVHHENTLTLFISSIESVVPKHKYMYNKV